MKDANEKRASQRHQLGFFLKSYLSYFFQIKGLNKQNCDLRDYDNLKSVIEQFKPDILINAAAFTNVEKAEINKSLAYEFRLVFWSAGIEEGLRTGENYAFIKEFHIF